MLYHPRPRELPWIRICHSWQERLRSEERSVLSNHPHIETAMVEQEVGGGKIPSCSDSTLSRALVESRVRGNLLVGLKSLESVVQASDWVVQL